MYGERITLFPLGAVSSSQGAREKCLESLLHCGADLERIHDQTWPNLARFIAHIERISKMNEAAVNAKAIVCLTQTCPIFLVTNTRQELTSKFPGLNLALWTVFADCAADPAFVQAAEKIGNLNGPLDDAPIWTVNQTGQRYLILTPNTLDTDRLKLNVRLLCESSPSVSAMRTVVDAMRTVVDASPEFTDSDLPTLARR